MNLLEIAEEITIDQWCELSDDKEFINQTRRDHNTGCYWVVYKTEDKYVKIHMFS